MTGVELIWIERERQIQYEGYDAKHDDTHTGGELRDAACSYALVDHPFPGERIMSQDVWPWPDGWKPSDDPIRNLAKAGALIAAEIDRLQRIAS